MLYSTGIMGLLWRWELWKIITGTLVQALHCFLSRGEIILLGRPFTESTLLTVHAKEEWKGPKK